LADANLTVTGADFGADAANCSFAFVNQAAYSAFGKALISIGMKAWFTPQI
jgi:hypothetical protein